MEKTDACYRINSPKVVHESVDGEVIIINFENGNYYSINETGAEIWDLLSAQVPVGRILGIMGRKYDGDARHIETSVNTYIEGLERESLILRCDPPRQEVPPTEEEGFTGAGTRPYSDPVLEKYDDMNELILLDPVHEVDEKGWPLAAE